MSAGTPPPPSGENPYASGGQTPPPPPPGQAGGDAGGYTSYPPAGQEPGAQPGAQPAAQPGGYPPPPPMSAGPRPGELLDRFLARLIDSVLLGVVNAIVVGVLVVGLIFGTSGSGFGFGDNLLASVVGSVLSTLIYLGYFGYMESNQGKTLGKMVMKLHVESEGGGKPTMEQAIKRNIWMALPLLGVIPILGSVLAGIGQLVAVIMIAVGINNDAVRRQPWTDKFAKTQVIKEG